jgi:hypothetical protein
MVVSESASRRAGVTVCALVALLAGACGDGTRPPDPEPSIGMLDPQKTHYQRQYSAWAVEYMRWQFQTPASVLWDVKDCVAYQDPESDVAFLEQDLAARTEPKPCAFSSKKAIFFPLLSLSSPVLYYTDSAMAPGSGDEDVLEQAVTDSMKDLVFEDVSVMVDESELREPRRGLIEPTGYSYTPYRGDNLLYRNYGVLDFPPVIEPAVVGGYWVLLAPLAPGPHEISISLKVSLSGPTIRSEFTYRLMLD